MKAESKSWISKCGTESFGYIVIDDLPADQQEPFNEWLYGQTCPVVDEELPKSCAYYLDYSRWYDHWINKQTAPIYD